MADFDEVAKALGFGAEDETPDVQPEGQGAEEEETPEEVESSEPTEDDEADVDGDHDDGEDEDEESEEDEESTEDDESDVPTEYMGIDLSGVPAEARQALIDGLKKSDSHANKVQQENAELRKDMEEIKSMLQGRQQDDTAEEEATFEVPSDEDLAKALGFDPDDPLYEVKTEAALPVAKEVVRLGQAVESLFAQQQQQELLTNLAVQLDDIATENKLSDSDVDEFLDYVSENETQDLSAAFDKWSAPRREAVEAKVEEQRKAKELLDKKRKAKTRRPQAPKSEPTEPATTEDAILEAAKELGITL